MASNPENATPSEIINFHGAQIETVKIDGRPYVGAKSVATGMGLDWKAMQRMIRRDEDINSTIVVTTTVAADGKSREMLCLPLDLLPGWIFKIPANRYKCDEVKARIRIYKRECFRALYDYWFQGGAVNPRATAQQLEALQDELAHWKAQVLYGDVSPRTGMPRTIRRRGTWVSPRRTRVDHDQLTLGLEVVV